MNKINIDNRNKAQIDNDLIESTVNDVLNYFAVKNSFIEIIFANKETISKLNKEYRNIDKPTDVLSFPQPEVKEAEIRILGSLVINLEVVNEKEENLVDVIKHGLLHLLGFDHEEDENNWQEAADKINCKL